MDAAIVDASIGVEWVIEEEGSASAEAKERLDRLLRAPVRSAASRDLLKPALELSLELRHPIYDCLYLALAQRRGLPLVTADERLVSAVRRRRIPSLAVVSLARFPGVAS
jgi:predicted nucleic acid-binding protein